jgi:hypothetical protein
MYTASATRYWPSQPFAGADASRSSRTRWFHHTVSERQLPRPFSPCLGCARNVFQHPIQISIEQNKMKRWPLITSFVLFITLCMSAAYWAMQLFNSSARPVSVPPQSAPVVPKLEAAAVLLGGHSHAAATSNFQLKGVVVAKNPSESVAILAVNGKAARAIRINREIVPGVLVSEVYKDHVLLSDNGVIKRVELPASAIGKMMR